MGLHNQQTGTVATSGQLQIKKLHDGDRVLALAGNPNVGKSTVFNELTGLNQHTGNWPGKTVVNAQGRFMHNGCDFILVDVPGTYSLAASSAEEEVARDFICFGEHDGVIVVTDATCLERNLNLVLQILETSSKAVVCVNLMDEARKKGIEIDFDELRRQLGVPVVAASARSGEGLEKLVGQVYAITHEQRQSLGAKVDYDPQIERAVQQLQPLVEQAVNGRLDARWLSVRLLDADASFRMALNEYLGFDLLDDTEVSQVLEQIHITLPDDRIKDLVTAAVVGRAEQIYRQCVYIKNSNYTLRDRKIDKILTSKRTGIPVMLLLLGIVFFITIIGANYPSQWLSAGLFYLEDLLADWFTAMHAPEWLTGLLVYGMYRTLAWVVSVMLPPMAIFFPLFTLLEDSGYLPRIAFNMDRVFKKARAHGKQILTMCMGFGCNTCGVTGCRIIDSPRERMLSIVTNSFVPCNGRFPMIISIITMFLAGAVVLPLQSAFAAVVLLVVILFGVFMTLAVSRALSATLLKGMPSSFTLELPPYRKPQIGSVIVRSILDRTIFVLGRAVAVAAPAGLLIWCMANISIGDSSLLRICADFLDPFGRFMGLDGMILMGFILGFPANEIVVPIIIMGYMCSGNIMELSNLTDLKTLLCQNGWTITTAICTIVFSLLHFPCATTCLTIYKETKSLRWTVFAFILPTVCGVMVCALITGVSNVASFF